MGGTLYVVATPIGNLEDMTFRAVRTLREASWIACEDTRQTQKLLSHYEIRTRLVSYHEHNEAARSAELVERLQAGESGALVSDAGTPLISDPGYRLVQRTLEAGLPVTPIPGACAVITALSASGLATDEFSFLGFVPQKKSARAALWERLKRFEQTAVLYEAPHRILETLQEIAAELGTRHVVLSRELTKLHEEFLRGSATEVAERLAERGAPRGEITLLLAKAEPQNAEDSLSPSEAVQRLIEAGVERMEAIKTVAREKNLPKREVYRLLQ